MQVWFKFKRRLKSRIYRDVATLRLLLIIISGVGISLLFASGSYVQSAFTSFISGDKSSLYEGMFGTGLVQFPSFGEYIRTAFLYPYLICGLLVAITIAWTNSKRRFLINVSLVAAAGLTAIDVLSGAMSTPEFGVSVACNTLAGIALALFSLTIVANISAVKFASDGNKVIERAMWIVWPSIYYFLLAGVIFFILAFIMKIPSSTVSIRLAPPMSGYVYSTPPTPCDRASASSNEHISCRDKTSEKKDDDKFNVLSAFSPNSGSETKWLGLGKKMSIDWRKKNSSPVSVYLRMVQGCTTRDQLNKMLKAAPFDTEVVRSDSNISVDNGLTQFQVISADYNGKIEVSDDEPYASQFWAIPATNDASKLSVQRFIYDGSMHLTDQFKPLSYEIGLFPSDEKDGWLNFRRLVISSEGSFESKLINVKFDDKPINPNLKLTCREVTIKPVKGGYTALALTPMVSLIVSVAHETPILYSDVGKPDVIEVNGANGWVSNDGFEKARIDNFVKVGKIAGMSVFGVISDVQVNEKSIATGPTSALIISGDLSASSDGPSIMIHGDADYMSLNDHRLTLTRWESLDMAMRVPLILGVPTLLYFLLRMLGQALRKPMRHLWYLPR